MTNKSGICCDKYHSLYGAAPSQTGNERDICVTLVFSLLLIRELASKRDPERVTTGRARDWINPLNTALRDVFKLSCEGTTNCAFNALCLASPLQKQPLM